MAKRRQASYAHEIKNASSNNITFVMLPVVLLVTVAAHRKRKINTNPAQHVTYLLESNGQILSRFWTNSRGSEGNVTRVSCLVNTDLVFLSCGPHVSLTPPECSTATMLYSLWNTNICSLSLHFGREISAFLYVRAVTLVSYVSQALEAMTTVQSSA
jgi:hypothetical protein